MRIDCSKEFKKLGKLADRMISRNGNAADILRDATSRLDAQTTHTTVCQPQP